MPLHPSVPPVLEILNESMKDLPRTQIGDIAMMREASLMPPVSEPSAVGAVEDRRIPGPAGEIPVRIYRPDGAPQGLVCFFHGGGFVMCNLETHDELCRALCRDTAAVVVSVDYRLAPEHPYPAAADDCFAALVWSAAHAGDFGVDAARIAVAGDSAGGNLAAVTALRARDQDGPALCHQSLIYPATHCRFNTASYQENAEGYFLTAEAMRWFWGHYLGDMARAAEPYACPANAASLAGLPPATIVTAEYDPLRDEAEDYGDALRAVGADVVVRRYAGMIHGFVSMAEIFEDGRDAQRLVAERLRQAFAGA